MNLNRLELLLRSSYRLLCISSPFYNPPAGLKPEYKALWDRFKSFEEYMPTEVKSLGIWLALQQKYGDQLSAVGWRSGSLDVAGFLGIPTYFLDNIPFRDEFENKKKPYVDKMTIEEHLSAYEEGWYLYTQNRQIKPTTNWYSRDCNEEAKDPDRKAGLVYKGEDAIFANRPERMEELSSILNNFIIIHVHDPAVKAKAFQISDKVTQHLAAALFVYSMSQPEGGANTTSQKSVGGAAPTPHPTKGFIYTAEKPSTPYYWKTRVDLMTQHGLDRPKLEKLFVETGWVSKAKLPTLSAQDNSMFPPLGQAIGKKS